MYSLDARLSSFYNKLRPFYPNEHDIHPYALISKAFEIEPSKVNRNTIDGYMQTWEQNVKLIIGKDLFDRIRQISNNYLIPFVSGINNELDADAITAMWIFQHLPTPGQVLRRTSLNNLLPMSEPLTKTVMNERKEQFKRFLSTYRVQALSEWKSDTCDSKLSTLNEDKNRYERLIAEAKENYLMADIDFELHERELAQIRERTDQSMNEVKQCERELEQLEEEQIRCKDKIRDTRLKINGRLYRLRLVQDELQNQG